MHIYALILLIPVLFIEYLLFSSVARNRRILSLLHSAFPLKRSPKLGAYISVQGKITSPRGATEFGKQDCSLYATRINGVFKTKRKKPNKGMETHRPMLYQNDNAHEPLVIKTATHVVHGLFENPANLLFSALTHSEIQYLPPNEVCRANTEHNYQHYEINESYLPLDSTVTVYGVVKAVYGNIVIISGDKKQDKPPLIFNGYALNLHKWFLRKISWAKLLAGMLIVLALPWVYVNAVAGATLTSDSILPEIVISIVVCTGFWFVIRKFHL